MTRNQIIEQLFTGKNFNDCISKWEPANLREDLKQEVSLIICEWPDEKVISLHEEHKLEFYVVRVIINMITNKYHPFYKKFRNTNLVYVEDPGIFENYNSTELRHFASTNLKVNASYDSLSDNGCLEERELKELKEDYTLDQIHSLNWYNRDLILVYLKLGTYRAVGQATGIPHISIFKNVKQSIEILKKKANAPTPVFSKRELSFIQNSK